MIVLRHHVNKQNYKTYHFNKEKKIKKLTNMYLYKIIMYTNNKLKQLVLFMYLFLFPYRILIENILKDHIY